LCALGALQTDKFCAISYQFGGPFIYFLFKSTRGPSN
jgi:hypothetical protein